MPTEGGRFQPICCGAVCTAVGRGRNDKVLKGGTKSNTPAAPTLTRCSGKCRPLVFITPGRVPRESGERRIWDLRIRVASFSSFASPQLLAQKRVEPTRVPRGYTSSRLQRYDNPLRGPGWMRRSASQSHPVRHTFTATSLQHLHPSFSRTSTCDVLGRQGIG